VSAWGFYLPQDNPTEGENSNMSDALVAIRHFLSIVDSNHSLREYTLAVDGLRIVAGGGKVKTLSTDEAAPKRPNESNSAGDRKYRKIVGA